MIEETYTSTGGKILLHPKAVADLQNKKCHPIMLHVMPTESCNLACPFCSVGERGNQSLDYEAIRQTVAYFKRLGLRAAILSGGGEPLLYDHIDDLIRFLSDSGLEMGLITNGTLLERLEPELLSAFSWIRISMNSIEQVSNINIPDLPPWVTLGFSYIWHRKTKPETLDEIRKLAKAHGAEYARLLPDCNLPEDEFRATQEKIKQYINHTGSPFFFQHKEPGQARTCYLGAVHPVLYADGYIYPCDSNVLNSEITDRGFHREYALCHHSEIEKFYSCNLNGSMVDVSKCPRCVFTRNNDLLADIINGKELANPIRVKHANFI